MCDGFCTKSVVPSPKFQRKLYGGVPPSGLEANETESGASPEITLAEADTLRGVGGGGGGGGTSVTAIVTEACPVMP